LKKTRSKDKRIESDVSVWVVMRERKSVKNVFFYLLQYVMRTAASLIGGNVLRSTETASKRRLFGGIDGKTQRKINDSISSEFQWGTHTFLTVTVTLGGEILN